MPGRGIGFVLKAVDARIPISASFGYHPALLRFSVVLGGEAAEAAGSCGTTPAPRLHRNSMGTAIRCD